MHHALHPPFPNRNLLLWTLAVLVCATCFLAYWYVPPPLLDRVEIKEQKSSGRNEKHANPDARSRAEEEYEKAKEEFEKLRTKRDKSKEDVQELNELKKRMKHWQKKKDWGGENHSQKHKGN